MIRWTWRKHFESLKGLLVWGVATILKLLIKWKKLANLRNFWNSLMVDSWCYPSEWPWDQWHTPALRFVKALHDRYAHGEWQTWKFSSMWEWKTEGALTKPYGMMACNTSNEFVWGCMVPLRISRLSKWVLKGIYTSRQCTIVQRRVVNVDGWI